MEKQRDYSKQQNNIKIKGTQETPIIVNVEPRNAYYRIGKPLKDKSKGE